MTLLARCGCVLLLVSALSLSACGAFGPGSLSVEPTSHRFTRVGESESFLFLWTGEGGGRSEGVRLVPSTNFTAEEGGTCRREFTNGLACVVRVTMTRAGGTATLRLAVGAEVAEASLRG